MTLSKTEAFNLATHAGRRFGFDPYLILAMMEQESGYETESVRLENGFFRKYMKPQVMATTNKVLFSTSFGLLQVMGESLRVLGLFDADPTPEGIAHAVNAYMVDPVAQVMTGSEWLRKKMTDAKTDDVAIGLKRYNGSDEYPPQVLARMDRLKKEHAKGDF